MNPALRAGEDCGFGTKLLRVNGMGGEGGMNWTWKWKWKVIARGAPFNYLVGSLNEFGTITSKHVASV